MMFVARCLPLATGCIRFGFVLQLFVIAASAVTAQDELPNVQDVRGNDGRYGSGYAASRPYRPAPAGIYVPQYVRDGRYRQPTSAAMLPDGTALVATKASGEVYRVDWHRSTAERVAGPFPARFLDVAVLGPDTIALADAANDEVWIVERNAAGPWRVLWRLDVPGTPAELYWDAAHEELWVAARWAQRVYCWRNHSVSREARSWERWEAVARIDLDFNPGRMLLLPRHEALVVASAFGQDFAVFDRRDHRQINRARFYGHNIAGLAVTEDESMIFFPHQLMNEFARAVTTDITWGGMISNNIRWLQVERVLTEQGESLFRQGRFFPLGSPGNGAADPSSLAVAPDGRMAITLGGTNRVAILRDHEFHFDQFAVGLHPVDCVFTPDASGVLVVNQFSDTVSHVDLHTGEVRHIELGPLRAPDLAERGEQLFFDARLAHDGWMSCHSCHSHGHTSGVLNDNFSDQSYGSPKRVLSLLGAADTAPYAWNASMPDLAAQIRQSVTSTMAGPRQPSDSQVAALVAFLRSLPAPPSLRAARQPDGGPADEADLETRFRWAQSQVPNGWRVFQQRGCTDCHRPPRFTDAATFDVGFEDENGMREFNPPSLIGVSQRAGALFHDASAHSIDDVLSAGHQLTEPLSERERCDLAEFLRAL